MNYTPRRNPFVARLMWRQGLARAFGLPQAWATSGAKLGRSMLSGREDSAHTRVWCAWHGLA